jgi:hypothetical protein
MKTTTAKYLIVAPATPGAQPSVVDRASSIAKALEIAYAYRTGRKDLRMNLDVCIVDAKQNRIIDRA